MLYCGFGEQVRHEHMSDEYKDRYIIRTLLKTPPGTKGGARTLDYKITHTGVVVLYCGFGEQVRHEHMSDEYKDRYIIRTLLKTPPRYYSQYREHLEFTYRTNNRGGSSSDIIKDLPNT